MPFFPLASYFMPFLLKHTQKSKFCDSFWKRKISDLVHLKAFQFYFLFLPFFSSFFYPFAELIDLLLGLLLVKKFKRQHHWDGNSYHGVAKWTQRKFCSEFSMQISEHFHTYFRLHSLSLYARPYHSDPSIIGKIFSSGRSWVHRPMLITAGYSQHRHQWVNEIEHNLPCL